MPKNSKNSKQVVLLTAAQIGKGELGDLGKRIAAHVEKVRGYEATAREKAGVELKKAVDHRDSITQLLHEAKVKCDGGGFRAFKQKYCPHLSRSRIYELLRIGSGRKTLEQSRTEKRASVARSRGKSPLQAVEDSPAVAPVGETSPKEEPVKGTALIVAPVIDPKTGRLSAPERLEPRGKMKVTPPGPTEDSAEASAEKRKGMNADLALSPEEKAAKASAHYLAEFSTACRTYLPKITIEADRQQARLLVSELTSSEPKMEAA